MRTLCKQHGKAGIGIGVALALFSLFLTAMPAHAVGTASGTVISNTASIAYQDAGANNYAGTSNQVDVTVSSVFTVSVTAPADSSGNSNTKVYYPYTVTNSGNASNTFTLSAASGAGGNTWTATLYADDGAGGGIANNGIHEAGETNVIATTGALAADATYKFFVAVTIPAGTANGQTDNTVLTVTGSGDAGAGDDTSDTVTTTAQAPALTVDKKVRNVTTAGAFAASGVTAKPTEILEYQLAVTNGGALQATSVVLQDTVNANLTYVAGSLWVGSNGATYNGAGNLLKNDAAAGDPACAIDACGAASYVAGAPNKVWFYLGNTANETTGGTLAAASTVYVYFRATVN